VTGHQEQVATHERANGLEEFHGKYGEKLGKFVAPAAKEYNEDLLEVLYDRICQLKDEDGEWSDEKESSAIDIALDRLSEMLGIAEEPVVEVTAEVAEEPKEEDHVSKIMKQLDGMKGRRLF
jgi:hypothetical protein